MGVFIFLLLYCAVLCLVMRQLVLIIYIGMYIRNQCIFCNFKFVYFSLWLTKSYSKHLCWNNNVTITQVMSRRRGREAPDCFRQLETAGTTRYDTIQSRCKQFKALLKYDKHLQSSKKWLVRNIETMFSVFETSKSDFLLKHVFSNEITYFADVENLICVKHEWELFSAGCDIFFESEAACLWWFSGRNQLTQMRSHEFSHFL